MRYIHRSHRIGLDLVLMIVGFMKIEQKIAAHKMIAFEKKNTINFQSIVASKTFSHNIKMFAPP